MPIVVDHSDTGHLPLSLKTAIHATKAIKSNSDLLDGDIEANAHSQGRCRIQDVMQARHVQAEFPQIPIPVSHPELPDRAIFDRASRSLLQHYPDVSSSSRPICHSPP